MPKRMRILCMVMVLGVLISGTGCQSLIMFEKENEPSIQETEDEPVVEEEQDSIVDKEPEEEAQPVEKPIVEPVVKLPTQAPGIGQIRISSSWIGDEYTDITITVAGVEGISEELSELEARIKLRGNTSKKLPKKSYNIKFDEKISLYGMGKGKKWSLLATAYEKSLLRTPIGFTYAQQLDIPYVSEFYFTELWINDVYKGVYILIEPVEEGKQRVDIDLEEGDFLIECNVSRDETDHEYIETQQGFRFEMNEPDEPTEEEKQKYLDWLNAAEEAIVSGNHREYEQYIDMDSFVDYYIFEEVTKNVDFGRFSTRYFCKEGKLYAGPPWDMDLTMGNVSTTYWEIPYLKYNNTYGYGNDSGHSTEGLWVCNENWYQWLCKDDYFMRRVVERWKELLPITRNLAEENELGISRIDYFVNGYQDAISRNYKPTAEGGAGWQLGQVTFVLEYSYPSADYTKTVEYMRQWILERIEWLDATFEEMQKTGIRK